MKLLMYYLIILLIAVTDQVVKSIIIDHVDLLEDITVIPGIFDITHIQNPGAAYNLFTEFPEALIAIPGLVMVIGMVYLAYSYKSQNTMLLVAISMVIGGGLGNLIDRIVKGYVVDFFDIHIIPVFNVADIFICIGCGLLFIYVIFIDRKQNE